MNRSNVEIAKHLPYLRRYARALTGSQRSGDAYIRLCLEAMVADPSSLQGTRDVKRELYRLFHQALATVGTLALDTPGEGAESRTTVAERLASLPPTERQLLLLTSVEGFDVADAAEIVGIDTDAADALLEDARGQMMRQEPTSVLIIEDEPVIALSLADLVRSAGHEVVGMAATREEAVAMANETRPGLVLADIRLQDDSSGVDAVHDILHQMKVPVVFITAYPERLLTGERPEPTFLVTKPFKPATVLVTISQALLTASKAAAV